MITKGMKIEAIKDMGGVIKPGEICEIEDVKSDMTISFRFRRVHLGVMSYEEYLEYFKPYKTIQTQKNELKKKRTWGRWKVEKLNYFKLNGSLNEIICEKRTNGQRIQMRTKRNDSYIKSRSSCCPNDKFDFEKGSELATMRLIMKLHQIELDEMVVKM